MSDFFSGIQAAMVINRLDNSDQSPEDWNSDCDGSGGSTGLPGTPCFTSRLSLLKVGSVIAQFSDFKRQLVREIGFDGMLELKSWQKINLKYIAYLMDRVDVDSSIINLEGQGVLEICDKNLNYVFGIPCGNSVIQGEGVEPSEACIEYTRVVASFSDRGTHSRKAAEAYLIRAITESSTEIEQDCFKIAFVIFVFGHVLAPTAKHDYRSIDFWAALNDISKIKDWNWGGYVLKNLFQAVRKFKADVSKRNPTVHIVGCHLFLQLFVLDSLDLGVLNRPRGVTPRIGLYDYDSMKKMVDKITVNVAAGEVAYHGAMVVCLPIVPRLGKGMAVYHQVYSRAQQREHVHASCHQLPGERSVMMPTVKRFREQCLHHLSPRAADGSMDTAPPPPPPHAIHENRRHRRTRHTQAQRLVTNQKKS